MTTTELRCVRSLERVLSAGRWSLAWVTWEVLALGKRRCVRVEVLT